MRYSRTPIHRLEQPSPVSWRASAGLQRLLSLSVGSWAAGFLVLGSQSLTAAKYVHLCPFSHPQSSHTSSAQPSSFVLFLLGLVVLVLVVSTYTQKEIVAYKNFNLNLKVIYSTYIPLPKSEPGIFFSSWCMLSPSSSENSSAVARSLL